MSMESGKCVYCGEHKILRRTYYRYNVVCDCCSGTSHFEYARHCKDCKPIPFSTIKVTLTNAKPVDDEEQQ